MPDPIEKRSVLLYYIKILCAGFPVVVRIGEKCMHRCSPRSWVLLGHSQPASPYGFITCPMCPRDKLHYCGPPVTPAHRPTCVRHAALAAPTGLGLPRDQRPTRGSGVTLAWLHTPADQLHRGLRTDPAPRTIESYPHDNRACVACPLLPRVDFNMQL